VGLAECHHSVQHSLSAMMRRATGVWAVDSTNSTICIHVSCCVVLCCVVLCYAMYWRKEDKGKDARRTALLALDEARILKLSPERVSMRVNKCSI
jgi:hypothetical protein